VFRCAGRIVTIFALCLALGLHWLALQSAAWTSMIVKYSTQQSLRVAIAQTFDGDHPCSLCHAVNNGKNSEKKSDLQVSTFKIDLICSTRAVRLLPPYVPFEYATVRFFPSERRQPPLLPPPRSFLS
jgi:hypothetical protein